MRHRFARKALVTIMAIVMLAAQDRMLAQDCSVISWISGNIATKGWLDSQGKRHLGVSLPGTMPPELTDAMVAALNEWNAQSSTTGVILDPGGNDLSIVEDTATLDANDLACASYDAGPDMIMFEIWFATEIERINDIDDPTQRASEMASFVALAQTVFAHEVGHFLGLAQGGSGSIMTGAQSGVTCASALNTIPSNARSVTDSDAAKVNQCATQYMMPGTELPAEPYVEPGPPPPGEYYECYGVWLVTETWRWNGHSWEFDSAQYELLGVVC